MGGTERSNALGRALWDSVEFWEPRRWIFNAVLAAVTLAMTFHDLHRADVEITEEFVGFLLYAVVAANLLYSAAYLLEVAVFLGHWQSRLRSCRNIAFGLGMALALLEVIRVGQRFPEFLQ